MGLGGKGKATTPAAEKPAFPTLAELRASIPAACFERNAAKSLAYVALNAACVATAGFLYFSAQSALERADPAHTSLSLTMLRWLLAAVYWFAQGTLFWGTFVLGKLPIPRFPPRVHGAIP